MGEPDFMNDPFFNQAELCWMNKVPGCIPPVRDQKYSSTCFAFPVVNSVFAEYKIKHPDVENIRVGAAQELLDMLYKKYPPHQDWSKRIDVDLKGSPNNYRNAFDYVKEEGIYPDYQYPFTGVRDKDKVLNDHGDLKIFIKDYGYINHKEPAKVIAQLEEQPLAAGVLFATSFSLWGRDQGIYQGPTEEEMWAIKDMKNVLVPRHAVLLVGHGEEDDMKYYQCQGTFGRSWGNDGYIKIRQDLISNVWYPIRTKTKYKV